MQCHCTVVYALVGDDSSTSRKPKFTHEVSRNVALFKLHTVQFFKTTYVVFHLCRYTAGVPEEDEEAGPAVQREAPKCRQAGGGWG